LSIPQLTIVDLGSHHGTFILKIGADASTKLAPEIPVTLSDGDVLTFGKTVKGNGGLVQPVAVRVNLEYEATSTYQESIADVDMDDAAMGSFRSFRAIHPKPKPVTPLPAPVAQRSRAYRYGVPDIDDMDEVDDDSHMSISSSSEDEEEDTSISSGCTNGTSASSMDLSQVQPQAQTQAPVQAQNSDTTATGRMNRPSPVPPQRFIDYSTLPLPPIRGLFKALDFISGPWVTPASSQASAQPAHPIQLPLPLFVVPGEQELDEDEDDSEEEADAGLSGAKCWLTQGTRDHRAPRSLSRTMDVSTTGSAPASDVILSRAFAARESREKEIKQSIEDQEQRDRRREAIREELRRRLERAKEVAAICNVDVSTDTSGVVDEAVVASSSSMSGPTPAMTSSASASAPAPTSASAPIASLLSQAEEREQDLPQFVCDTSDRSRSSSYGDMNNWPLPGHARSTPYAPFVPYVLAPLSPELEAEVATEGAEVSPPRSPSPFPRSRPASQSQSHSHSHSDNQSVVGDESDEGFDSPVQSRKGLRALAASAELTTLHELKDRMDQQDAALTRIEHRIAPLASLSTQPTFVNLYEGIESIGNNMTNIPALVQTSTDILGQLMELNTSTTQTVAQTHADNMTLASAQAETQALTTRIVQDLQGVREQMDWMYAEDAKRREEHAELVESLKSLREQQMQGLDATSGSSKRKRMAEGDNMADSDADVETVLAEPRRVKRARTWTSTLAQTTLCAGIGAVGMWSVLAFA
jgi:hypothetical protein